jgi:hypothetical protein
MVFEQLLPPPPLLIDIANIKLALLLKSGNTCVSQRLRADSGMRDIAIRFAGSESTV